MEKFRLLPLSVRDAFTNMAIDEAVLGSVARGDSTPTLRFYRWDPSAVSIGCFQGLNYEVDMERVSEVGVDVVRRITGGGAVFHDHEGELTYSFVSGSELVPGKIIDSFRKICRGLVNGLGNLGLSAQYSEVNDVLVNGKKVSGSAQTRRYGGVLQHGTILIDPDIRFMFELLKVPPEKITDKFISSVYERVTSISRELDEEIDFEAVREAMIKGFEEELSVEFAKDDITDEELSLAKNLRENYISEDWLGKR